ncbi:hypothetical protein JYT87_02780 [Nitrospira defluvii]|nr:hypothetical protein [Nitrospira defluvii]
MKTNRNKTLFYGTGILFILLWSSTGFAQTFNSGSTGADGALAPVADTTLALPPDGVFNFTTVDVPAGVTISFTPNSTNTPVTILASGNVNVDGSMSVNGEDGASSATGLPLNLGGSGGPGGFPGGPGGLAGGSSTPAGGGQGPGGGGPSGPGSYGAPAGFVTLIPLFGGSGGGGGVGGSVGGPSGGGGAGAIVIASSTQITVNGSITARGGNGHTVGQFVCDARRSGPGSGGAIRLVAPQVDGSGSLDANGGATITNFGGAAVCNSRAGLTRIETFNLGFTGSVSTTSIVPGPVTSASTPALITLPTLAISSVGGISSPTIPSGSFTTADISLPAGSVNPVPVTLTITNTPVGTLFSVILLPQNAFQTIVSSTPSTGTFSSSTATANLTFPLGQVSLLNVFSTFTLPTQVASLFPLIDGEAVERVMLAAKFGQPSTLTLVTKSGKEIPAKEVMNEKQFVLLWKEVVIQK